MRVKCTDDESDDIMTVSEVIAIIADDDLLSTLEQENTMAAKKTKAAAAPEETTKKSKKTKAAAAPAEKGSKKEATKEKGTFGPRTLPEGYVGVAKLAEDSKLAPAIVRRRLRGLEGVEKNEEHGWAWKSGSKDYDKVLKALTAEA